MLCLAADLPTAVSRTCLTWLISMPVAAAQVRILNCCKKKLFSSSQVFSNHGHYITYTKDPCSDYLENVELISNWSNYSLVSHVFAALFGPESRGLTNRKWSLMNLSPKPGSTGSCGSLFPVCSGGVYESRPELHIPCVCAHSANLDTFSGLQLSPDI